MGKGLNLLNIIAITFILTQWLFTGHRPYDWYIATLLLLNMAGSIIEYFS